MNQQTAFDTVANLVKDFKTNESKYFSSNYSEADVRKDFMYIDFQYPGLACRIKRLAE